MHPTLDLPLFPFSPGTSLSTDKAPPIIDHKQMTTLLCPSFPPAAALTPFFQVRRLKEIY